MIYIFNEVSGKPDEFNLIISDPEIRAADLYVTFDQKWPNVEPDLSMKSFHPCVYWHEVHETIEPFGYNPVEDMVFYFRDGMIVPALSAFKLGAGFTISV